LDDSNRHRLSTLLVRLADGDRSAFTVAYVLIAPLARRIAVRSVGAADAEDVTQQALMNVFARCSQLDRERDALAWVLGIVTNECRTLHKRRLRRRDAPVAEGQLEAVRDPRPTAEETLTVAELSELVRETLGELRASDIAAIRSALWEEPPTDSTARPATLRKRLSRAMSRLQKAWRAKHELF
jgi:DNA-directed RNA polymerase specialized sigma24 family protein